MKPTIMIEFSTPLLVVSGFAIVMSIVAAAKNEYPTAALLAIVAILVLIASVETIERSPQYTSRLRRNYNATKFQHNRSGNPCSGISVGFDASSGTETEPDADSAVSE